MSPSELYHDTVILIKLLRLELADGLPLREYRCMLRDLLHKAINRGTITPGQAFDLYDEYSTPAA